MFAKCPNQGLQVIKASKRHEPGMIFIGSYCNMESLEGKTVIVSHGQVFPLVGISERGTAFGVEPTIIHLAAKRLGFRPNFQFERLWLTEDNTTGRLGGIYGKV